MRWLLVVALSIITAGGAPFFIAGAAVLASVTTAPKAPLLIEGIQGDLDDAALSKRPNKDRRRRRRTLRTAASYQLRSNHKGTRTLAAGTPGPDSAALATTAGAPPPVCFAGLVSTLPSTTHRPTAEALYVRHCALLI
jgi:hypothetical protein